MGSRAKRARQGQSPVEKKEVPPPVPQLRIADVVFGSIGHLPAYNSIPDIFKSTGNPYCRFISHWFFSGLAESDIQRLTARDGVDRGIALAAIKAILASFEPKHEHKEAGAAYLLHAWFELRTS